MLAELDEKEYAELRSIVGRLAALRASKRAVGSYASTSTSWRNRMCSGSSRTHRLPRGRERSYVVT
jgi:hypothetical protein